MHVIAQKRRRKKNKGYFELSEKVLQVLIEFRKFILGIIHDLDSKNRHVRQCHIMAIIKRGK